MLNQRKIVCVLPAFNAAKTLEETLRDVPTDLVDLFIVVDDCSTDETVKVANSLSSRWPLKVIQHEKIEATEEIKKLVMKQLSAKGLRWL